MSGLDPTVQSAIVGLVGAVLVALISLLGILMQRHNKTLNTVRDQVQNSHSTNLRDDVDRVLEGVAQLAEMSRAHGYELGHLRRDLQQERVERQALSERVDEHVITASANAAAAAAAIVSTGPASN
jgi:Protein of unknown function (DUF2746)